MLSVGHQRQILMHQGTHAERYYFVALSLDTQSVLGSLTTQVEHHHSVVLDVTL